LIGNICEHIEYIPEIHLAAIFCTFWWLGTATRGSAEISCDQSTDDIQLEGIFSVMSPAINFLCNPVWTESSSIDLPIFPTVLITELNQFRSQTYPTKIDKNLHFRWCQAPVG
jgi:hypothetical protein